MNIEQMAREAGYFLYDLTETHGERTVETDEKDQWAVLQRFAALVRAHALEEAAITGGAVAEICRSGHYVASAIRALKASPDAEVK